MINEKLSNEAQNHPLRKGVVICRLSDLGRNGLTWDWSKLELNKQYFVSREDILNMNMLWQLAQGGITEQALKLNAEVLMWEDVIKNGWYLLLRPQGGI
jgi:hypothetical protein